MAQVAAGCRRWIVSAIIIFLCFLQVNCVIDERNQVLFSQAEYTFEEDLIVDGTGPFSNLVDICYLYSFLEEGISVNILTFTTDGTATGDYCCGDKFGCILAVLMIMSTYAGGEDFVPFSDNVTRQLLFPEEMCVTVALLVDTMFEDDEQFTLTVVVDDLSLNEQFSSNVTITIQDNDCK